jgi:hypothetical protein
VRGTRPASVSSAAAGRFIPARAGNAASAIAFMACASVHPRACGERRSIMQEGR